MNSTTEMSASAMEKNTDNSAVQSARQVLTSFVSTLKKLNLYSNSHTIYQEGLNLLKKGFDTHFESFGNLRLDIKRDQITIGDEVVHQGQSEPTDIAFVLYRDGILWLEFTKDMELWEIDTFLSVFNKYAKLEEDAEDDIVTALWQYNLPSVLYEATEPNLDGEEDIDFSQLKCRADVPSHEIAENTDPLDSNEKSSAQSQLPKPSMPPLAQNDDIWGLTPEETEQLRKMIAEEEKLDGTDYIIEVLLYILEKQVQPDDDLLNLLDILAGELREVLVQGRYTYLANVFVHFKKYMEKVKVQNHFSYPYLEGLFMSLSKERFLGGLSQTWEYVDNSRTSEIKELKRLILMLHESAVFTLAPMLGITDSPKIHRLLLEIIGIFGQRNFDLIEKLINTSAPLVVVQLMRVLRSLNDEKAKKILISLLHHESELVREEVLKNQALENDASVEEIFKLINDSDENIRKMVLLQIGQKRNPQIEEMLLEYIQTHDSLRRDPIRYFDILRALGRCGSERSLPFLNGQLFMFPSLGILRPKGSKHRHAVLAALKELNTKNATFLAKRASRGFFYNFLRPSKLRRIEN